MTPAPATEEPLRAPHVVEFPFTRSLGPVQSAFLTGLRERTVLGIRGEDGRVIVPPLEYDPASGAGLGELVEVAATGTVTTWAWVGDPGPKCPLDTPFAWALVRLDGAGTALLHALDAPGPEAVHTGMRVRVRWAAERSGSILDIACFEPLPPGGDPGPDAAEPAPHSGEFTDPVTVMTDLARLDYTHTPGRAQARFLRNLADRRFTGERCPSCEKVYVPPRGACPTCGVATDEEAEVGPRGTVTTFCVVNIGSRNLDIEVPWVYAHIALDGAGLALHGRIAGIPWQDVRMGLRVEPVWTDGRYPDHYRPTGEPDAAYETYREVV